MTDLIKQVIQDIEANSQAVTTIDETMLLDAVWCRLPLDKDALDELFNLTDNIPLRTPPTADAHYKIKKMAIALFVARELEGEVVEYHA